MVWPHVTQRKTKFAIKKHKHMYLKRVPHGSLGSELKVELNGTDGLVTRFEINSCINFTWQVLKNDELLAANT
jgi:hypothetical protein